MILNTLGALVAMLVTLQGSNAATPTGGSPSGFAMRLQGKGEIAVPATKFSAGTAGSFPTNATGHTWTMWIKAYHPLGGGKRMFLLGEAETFLYCPFLDFKGQTADGVPINAFIDETGTPGGNLGETYAELFDTWTHLAYTVDIGTGTGGKNVVKTYVNGVEKTSSEMSENVGFDELPGFAVGGYVGFGQELPNLDIVQDHFNGLMDEIAIYKKVLTGTEIANSMNKKLTGSEADLVMYWDFDDMADYTAGEVDNKASAGGAQYNLMLGQSYGKNLKLSAPSAESCRFDVALPHHYCDQMPKPKFVPAAIPGFSSTEASGYVATAFYAKVGGSNVEFELPGADLDDANAALTYTISTPVGEGTLPAPVGNKVTFTPPPAFSNPSTSFAYTVTSGGTVSAPTLVTIYYVSAPTAFDVSLFFFEDTAGEIIMESYDELGLLSSFEITSLPTEGTLSSVDGTGAVIAEITSVPTVVTTNRLKFLPDKDKTSERTFTYKATNGFASSAEATVTISIISADDIPDPAGGDATAVSSGRLELDLSCGKACDPDSNFTTVIIEELPINGQLYLDSGTTNNVVEKFDPFFVPPMESQYVNKILEQSTQYRTGSGKWSGLALVGPPDAPLVYGDSSFANCFLDKAAPNKLDPVRCGYTISTGNDPAGNLGDNFDPDGITYGGHYFGATAGLGLDGYDDIQHECALAAPGCTSNDIGNTIATECWNAQESFDNYGWSQFFTVQFVNQVYIKSLKFGINRGAGSVWSIEAYDRASGKWQTIYKADEITNDQATFHKITNQYNTFIPYPLCEPSFKTDIIKVKIDTITVDDWNEFDYIELAGSQMQAPGVISSGKVHYEAGSGSDAASCIDNFKYSVTDCGGSITRTSPTSQYNVKPFGADASLPNCATPATVVVTAISTTFAPTVFNAAHLNTIYAFEAIPAETNGENTWTYDRFTNLFTFDLSNTDSDKTSYEVKYNVMNQGTTTIVAIQTVTFAIDGAGPGPCQTDADCGDDEKCNLDKKRLRRRKLFGDFEGVVGTCETV